jgi:exopolysaccharide biosynthesis operon protein EpsL
MTRSKREFYMTVGQALKPLLGITCLFSFSLLPQFASADEQDTFNFTAGAGMRFEDNLFRLSDPIDTGSLPGRPNRSDTIYTAKAGFKIDKTYSLQRFKIDLTATENKFQKNSFLDYTGLNYSAAWLWQLTPRISGVLLASQEQSLINFADFRSFGNKNIQTSQVKLFSIDGDLGGGWHAIGGILDIRARNSQQFTEVGDYVQQGVELGGKYVSRAENWVSLVRRESNGEYSGRVVSPVTQLDSGFKQSDIESKAYWKLTGKSRLDGMLGYVDRRHDNFGQRDYSGMVGKIQYTWEPTAKIDFKASLSRNLFSFQNNFNSYYVADTFSIGPSWEITAKTRVWARYDLSDRDYRGSIIQVTERNDMVQSFLVGGEWKPLRTVTVGAALQRDTRASNFNRFDYEANAASIYAQLLF